MKAPVDGMPGKNRTRSTNHTTRPLNRSDEGSFCWLVVERLGKSTDEGGKGMEGREGSHSLGSGGRWIVMAG